MTREVMTGSWSWALMAVTVLVVMVALRMMRWIRKVNGDGEEAGTGEKRDDGDDSNDGGSDVESDDLDKEGRQGRGRGRKR